MNKKNIIIQIILVLILILIIVSIFFVNIDLKFFKMVSINSIATMKDMLDVSENNLAKVKSEYKTIKGSLDQNKDEYKKEKEKYEAISPNTISIIKEATTEEKYSTEYIWIKLGNYAKRNNLSLSLVEPGGTVNKPTDTTTDTTTETTKQTNTTTPTTDDKSKSTTENIVKPNVEQPTGIANTNNELMIKIKGNYIDVSDFIFEVENDKELRFKLDKIKMEYAGNNQITASFIVKNMVFIK